MAIIELLEASPLPWTSHMLVQWFGKAEDVTQGCLKTLFQNQRVWRIEPGVYTSRNRYAPPREKRKNYGPKVLVTDEMLARYGLNL